MITCEKGLGKMLPHACGRRWRIANDIEPGDCGLTQVKCVTCVHGERRSKVAKLPPRKATSAERNNGRADRCCTFCGEVYQPKTGGQKYCKRERCARARGALHSKRAIEKIERRPLTPWPDYAEERPAPDEVQHAHTARKPETPMERETNAGPVSADLAETAQDFDDPPLMMPDDQLREMVEEAFAGARAVMATDAAAGIALRLMKKVRAAYERPDLADMPPVGAAPEEPTMEPEPEPEPEPEVVETAEPAEPATIMDSSVPAQVVLGLGSEWSSAVDQFIEEFAPLLAEDELDYLRQPILYGTAPNLWGLIMMRRARAITPMVTSLSEHSYTVRDDLPVVVHVRKPSQVIIRLLD